MSMSRLGQEDIFDDQLLKTFDQSNQHFSIEKSLNENGQLIGFICIYQLLTNRIDLQYNINEHRWKILSKDIQFDDHQQFDRLLEDVNQSIKLNSSQQIQMIIYLFDKYLDECLRETNEELKKRNSPKPSPIIEVDEERSDTPIPTLSLSSASQTNRLIPTNRTRHDSSCSSASSIKYTQFVPPSTTSVCRRKVIQSIHLLVQRKKSFWEKFSQALKNSSVESTLGELGSEFLRVYDGKFNYPRGHTFVIDYKNKTWLLTVDRFKCVECELNQAEPRSVVVLQYKNFFTTVQV